MEGVQLPSAAAVDCTSLIGIEQGRQDDCIVHLEFHLQSDISSLSHWHVICQRPHLYMQYCS